MSNTYVLVDTKRGPDGELIDVYEHPETGNRIEREVPSDQ